MKVVGEFAWLLEFGDADERQANERARGVAALLYGLRPEGLVEAVPAARSLFVQGTPRFDAGLLLGLETNPRASDGGPRREHEIPVAADGEDLAEVCGALGLSPTDFWKTVLGGTYVVGFLGFSPGFAYLYGLPRGFQRPRRPRPRVSVPAGTLAMAGPYVGIYPAAMPGGWNLIGSASAVLFDPRKSPPTLFTPGDVVRFVG